MTFASLGLSAPITNAVTEQGYEKPSPIQAQAIPAILQGKDVMAAAQTGTGKTAGFALPILEQLLHRERPRANQVRVLVLAPTRELAAQVGECFEVYGQHTPVRCAVVYGGVKINPQMMKLRKGVDILVATPGRLLDLYQQNAIKFEQLEVLVLDEADRMLDMGFIHDIRKLLTLLPAKRQNLLFSATFSQAIRQLAKGLVTDPVEISVNPENSTAKTVKQWIVPVDKKRKPELLIRLIREHQWHQALVFSKTKHGANRLALKLEKVGIKAAAIHGNKSQGARTRALDAFKKNNIQILVATDIAARGLDIDQLPYVINVDLPAVAEDYVHRIGRTGRAGASGEAISLVCADEFDVLVGIERLIQKVLPREEVEGFEPDHRVPESPTHLKPLKPKKPKKPKQKPLGLSTNASGKGAGHTRKKPDSAKANGGPGRRSGSGSKSGANSKAGVNPRSGNRRPSGGGTGAGRPAGSGRPSGSGRTNGANRARSSNRAS
ncbi:MAG: DEAD/DEAH box helicase [Pseudomonadales bacterium]|nr:DEAD/DEAH box helicase [Pseudomonadales bacterium]